MRLTALLMCLLLIHLNGQDFSKVVMLSTGAGDLIVYDRPTGRMKRSNIRSAISGDSLARPKNVFCMVFFSKQQAIYYGYNPAGWQTTRNGLGVLDLNSMVNKSLINPDSLITNDLTVSNNVIYEIKYGSLGRNSPMKSVLQSNYLFFLLSREALGQHDNDENYYKFMYLDVGTGLYYITDESNYLKHVSKLFKVQMQSVFWLFIPDSKLAQEALADINKVYVSNSLPPLDSNPVGLEIMIKEGVILRQGVGYIEVIDLELNRIGRINHPETEKLSVLKVDISY